jgi:hypothetical protein
MRSSYRNWIITTVLSGAVLVGVTIFAEEKKGDETKAETKGEQVAAIVEDLGLAAQLAAFGRGEFNDLTGLKDFKSPDALVAAGGMTLRAYKETAGQIKANPAEVQENGKAVSAEGAPMSLDAEAEALFDEARVLATDKAAVEAKIKQAKLVTARGAAGGPQVINRTIRTGKTHTLHIAFEPNSRASVTMRGTSMTQFEVIGQGGNLMWHSKGAAGTYTWHTAKGNGSDRNITVKIINNSGPPVAYTVFTN